MQKLSLGALALIAFGCAPQDPAPAPAGVDEEIPVDAAGNTAPTTFTAEANAEVLAALPLSDDQDFADAERGLIARAPELKVLGEDGQVIWDMPAYDFIKDQAPASVNPSLWRQARLNNLHGLYEVSTLAT